MSCSRRIVLFVLIVVLSLKVLAVRPSYQTSLGMFKRAGAWLKNLDTRQLNYGVAVSDVDNDGNQEWIVAGYSGINFVLSYDKTQNRLNNIAIENSPYEALRDPRGKAIGVCACDIDGDGREEIYFLNTNSAYAGRSSYGDKLFKWRNGKYVDLYSDPLNSAMPAKDFAGRSVACIDRFGTGKYSFIIATYSSGGDGSFAMVEMDETHQNNDVRSGTIVLRNVAAEAGVAKSTGGRGVVVGPILGNAGKSDIFFGNEGNRWMGNPGDNFLFENTGNGRFRDIARETGVSDPFENVRGVTIGDFNRDGMIDIAYGNWDGNHRLFLQGRTASNEPRFRNIARGNSYENSTRVRTVIASDFDNDGTIEIFFNNIAGQNDPQPNKLFRLSLNGQSTNPTITMVNIGNAIETVGRGTGASITDMDGDGVLDLLISHGENKGQPLRVYRVHKKLSKKNNWLRVLPRTQYGAPARGALVKVTTKSGSVLTSVIDGGSGYLCQMEPFAHFGLGSDSATKLFVQWPDGRTTEATLKKKDNRQVHIVDHPNTQARTG